MLIFGRFLIGNFLALYLIGILIIMVNLLVG